MADRAEPGDPQEPAPVTAAAAGLAHVFISYASHDAPVAQDVCSALEAAGLPCWMAPRDVKAGALYADAIVRAISNAKAFVVVLSQSSIQSSHVGKEIERASAKSCPVIALRMDNAPLTPALEYFLSESQWVETRPGDHNAAYARLIDSIRDPLKPAAPSASLVNSRGVRWRRRNWIWLAAGIAALAVATLSAGKLWPSNHRAAEQPVVEPGASPAAPIIAEKSIAVLPFVDMSEKHDQEYFSDGLSEELIDHLAHNADLKVIARTSSFAFKGKNEDMRSIATKLGAANLLEGSVRKSGGQLRITAQLIRAADGVHLWSEIYDRKPNDIFKVQDEISTTVAKALNAALSAPPVVAGQEGGTPGRGDIAAYNQLLKGTFFFMRGERNDTAKAVESYRQALTLQPQYALAWAMLARAYAWAGNSWQGDTVLITPAEAAVKGRDAAQRALAIDPKCATAYYALGNIARIIDGNWMAAQSDYKRTVELDPQGEVGREAQGNILLLKGSLTGQYSEVIDWLRSDQKRDPLNVGAFSDLAEFEFFAGSLEESASDYRRLLELDSAFATAQADYGRTLLWMGKKAEALAQAEKETDDLSRFAELAAIYWAMDRRAESDAALHALKRGFADRNAYLVAATYAYRGEAYAAFTWLERAYQQAKGSLQDLRADPKFRNLHGDPRFAAMLRKARLIE